MSTTQSDFTPDMGGNAIDIVRNELSPDDLFKLLFIDVVDVSTSFSEKVYKAFHKTFVDFAKARQDANDAFNAYHSKIEDFRTEIRVSKESEDENKRAFAKHAELPLDGFLMVRTETEFELRRLEGLGAVQSKVAEAVKSLKSLTKKMITLEKSIEDYMQSSVNVVSFTAGEKEVNVFHGRTEEELDQQFEEMFTSPNWLKVTDNIKAMFGASRELYEKAKKNTRIEKSYEHFQRMIVDLDVMFSLSKKGASTLNDKIALEQTKHTEQLTKRIELRHDISVLKVDYEEDSDAYIQKKTRIEESIAMLDSALNKVDLVALTAQAQALTMSVDSLWATYRRERKVGWTDTKAGVKSLHNLTNELTRLLNEVLYFHAEFKKKEKVILPEIKESFEVKRQEMDGEILDTVREFKEEIMASLPESVTSVINIDDLGAQLDTMYQRAKIFFENNQEETAIELMNECSRLFDKISENKTYLGREKDIETCSDELNAILSVDEDISSTISDLGKDKEVYSSLLGDSQKVVAEARIIYSKSFIEPQETLKELQTFKSRLDAIQKSLNDSLRNQNKKDYKKFVQVTSENYRVIEAIQERINELRENAPDLLKVNKIQSIIDDETRKIKMLENIFRTSPSKALRKMDSIWTLRESVSVVLGGAIEKLEEIEKDNEKLNLEEEVEFFETEVVMIDEKVVERQKTEPSTIKAFINYNETIQIVEGYTVDVQCTILDAAAVSKAVANLPDILNKKKAKLTGLLARFGSVTMEQILDRIDRIIIKPRREEIRKALEQDPPNLDLVGAILEETQNDVNKLLRDSVMESQVSAGEKGKKRAKDALAIAAMAKDLAVIVIKLALTLGADPMSYINLVKLLIKLFLFIKDMLKNLSMRINELSVAMLKLHTRLQEEKKLHWIAGKILSSAGLDSIVGTIGDVKLKLMKMRSALDTTSLTLLEKNRYLNVALSNFDALYKNLKKEGNLELVSTFANLEKEINKGVIFVHTEMEKLNRGIVLADKADRDLENYMLFTQKWRSLSDLVLNPGYKGQAAMLVGSVAWNGASFAVEIETGSSIAGHIGTALTDAIAGI